jgi:hypothetical protein
MGELLATALLICIPLMPISFWAKEFITVLYLTIIAGTKFALGEPAGYSFIYCITYFLVLSAVTSGHDWSYRNAYVLSKTIDSQRNKMEGLLKKIYPEPVFNKIKHMENPTFVQHFDNVSIMFLDIVGFTKFASDKSPDKVVEMLDSLFSRIDASCKLNGAIKIKTIGDAYLATTGMTDDSGDHYNQIVDLACGFYDLAQHPHTKKRASISLVYGTSKLRKTEVTYGLQKADPRGEIPDICSS